MILKQKLSKFERVQIGHGAPRAVTPANPVVLGCFAVPQKWFVEQLEDHLVTTCAHIILFLLWFLIVINGNLYIKL